VSKDVESQLIANIKEASFFTIHLDESFDITGKAQPLAFSRYVCNKDITEQFLFCKPLPEITEGQDILDVVDSHFSSYDLPWKSRISMCMDGAPSLSGSLKGFIILSKKRTLELFLHTFSCIEGPSFQNQYHLRSKKYWM
jgi:hypothetical protein